MCTYFKHIIIPSLLILFFHYKGVSQNTLVQDINQFNEAMGKAQPGDTITIKDGNWKDVEFLAKGEGSAEKPIVITAETPGKVIVSGNSNLKISGNFIVVKGLWFKNGYTDQSAVISFRTNSSTFANNCRVTDCTVSNYNPKENFKNYYVEIWGKNNRFDHNNLTGKTNLGTTLVVWLKGKEHTENNHRIDHNVFGERPELGQNTGETIRIGTSTYSEESSKTTVENNFFEKCNGEIEIISNKSGDNIYRSNLFFECEGTLTLRHGDRALVENNVFLGNNKPETGGIRIINEGHTVRNNLLVATTGDNYRAPIVIMNGVPNSPLNRYKQVKNVNIQNNTLINCSPMVFGAGSDEEKSLPPIQTIFANNLITNANSEEILVTKDDISGIKFSGNFVNSEAPVNSAYFTKAGINWTSLSSLPVPTDENPALKNVQKLKNSPETDITGAIRSTYVAGAFNLNPTDLPEAIKMKVGPSYKPKIEKVKPRKDSLIIGPEENLRKVLSKSSTSTDLYLKPGTYYIDRKIQLTGNIKIKGLEKGKVILKVAENLDDAPLYYFRVNSGRLVLEDLTLDASGEHVPKYCIVSPSEDSSKKYSVFINNCDFLNFTNTNGGSIYKAYSGTFADTISFKNSRIENGYRGLNLSFEKEGSGKINAQTIIIENTAFKDIEEFAVNFACEGQDCQKNAGKLVIKNSVFSNIYNEEDGVIIKTKGIKHVEITNSVFERSYNVKYPVKLVGKDNFIYNSVLFDSKEVKFSKGAREKNLMYKKPKWDDDNLFIPSKNSYLLKENNGIDRIGLLPNHTNNYTK